MIRECRAFADVMANPHDNAPRLALAAEVAAVDVHRARHIELEITYNEQAARFIREGEGIRKPDPELWNASSALSEAHGARWHRDEGGGPGWITRGLVGGMPFEPSVDPANVRALDEWPILHMSIRGPVALQPAPVKEALSRMVSLFLDDTDDAAVEDLLTRHDLTRLRKLDLRADRPRGLTERAAHALCTADVPMLEDLRFNSLGGVDPCEHAQSIDYTQRLRWSQLSKFGAELEEKYGWKRFFHGASRFAVYPYRNDVLDILPRLPDYTEILPRLWNY